jgi:hypothetical protein
MALAESNSVVLRPVTDWDPRQPWTVLTKETMPSRLSLPKLPLSFNTLSVLQVMSRETGWA